MSSKNNGNPQVTVEIELFLVDPLADQSERLTTVDAHVIWTIVRLNQTREFAQRSFTRYLIGQASQVVHGIESVIFWRHWIY